MLGTVSGGRVSLARNYLIMAAPNIGPGNLCFRYLSFRFSPARAYHLVISTMPASVQAASPHQGPTLGHKLFLAVTWILKGLCAPASPWDRWCCSPCVAESQESLAPLPVDLFERNGRSFLVSTTSPGELQLGAQSSCGR